MQSPLLRLFDVIGWPIRRVSGRAWCEQRSVRALPVAMPRERANDALQPHALLRADSRGAVKGM